MNGIETPLKQTLIECGTIVVGAMTLLALFMVSM